MNGIAKYNDMRILHPQKRYLVYSAVTQEANTGFALPISRVSDWFTIFHVFYANYLSILLSICSFTNERVHVAGVVFMVISEPTNTRKGSVFPLTSNASTVDEEEMLVKTMT